jgi:flagella basal body P-ring formation protein FlgA
MFMPNIGIDRALLLVALVAATAPVDAAPPQDLAIVREVIERFAVEQTRDLPGDVSVDVPALDPRLQLTSCSDLQPYLPAGAKLWGRTHIGMRCNGPDRWSVTVQATVRVMGSALYTARPIGRGQRLTETDVAVRSADLAQLPPGVLTDAEQATGKLAGIALSAGLPLRREMLHGERVVTAGQTVRVVFTSNGLQVSSEGKALAAGAVGDDIQVRAASGKVIRVTVTGPGVVQVR